MKLSIKLVALATISIIDATLNCQNSTRVNAAEYENPWTGTYVSSDTHDPYEPQSKLKKLIIGSTQTKNSRYFKVHAWLTGLGDPKHTDELFIDNVESYTDLKTYQDLDRIISPGVKKPDEETIIASFPKEKNRPVIVITSGPVHGEHFKYINATCYWSVASPIKPLPQAFYIKRRLNRLTL